MISKLDKLQSVEKSMTSHKMNHIRLCLEGDMESYKSNGFENYQLINQSLPELDFKDIDTSCLFLGKKISAPFIILPMTGGSRISTQINKNLASAAQELDVVMCVGSQRIGLENPKWVESYQVRDVAPDIPLLANLGAVYLNYGYGIEEYQKCVDMIQADAFSLYLNPMQKLLQGVSDLNLAYLTEKISLLCRSLSVPVVVKDVGFGMSLNTVKALAEAGVKMLDIAGAGGTSWAKITRYTHPDLYSKTGACFDDWGIPTAKALITARGASGNAQIIASGGIRNGLDIAKALALGADYVGMALPLLKPATQSKDAVKSQIQSAIRELKIAMFCCGVKTLSEFRGGRQVIEPSETTKLHMN